MTDRGEGQWFWHPPTNLTPDGFWCVTITIPADQQYFDALTGALGLLSRPESWLPSVSRGDREAIALAWETALYMNPFQVSDTCVVASPPPIPNEGVAKDWSASILTLFFEHIISEMNSLAPTPDQCGNAVAAVMAELAPYGANAATEGMLQQLCAQLNAMSSGQRAEYAGDCHYTTLFQNLADNIGSNPYDWLNKTSDWLFAWLNQTSDSIVKTLNTVAGLLGGGALVNFVNDNGGPGGGASFGSTCPWTVIFDFILNSGGFSIHDEFYNGCGYIIPAGSYSADGWHTVETHDHVCDLHDENLWVTRPEAFTAVGVRLRWYVGSPSGLNQGCYIQDGSSGAGIGTTTFITGWNNFSWTGSQSFSSLHLHGAQSNGGAAPSIRVTRLEIDGTGTNPF